jgi:penicillin-binding protein 1A
MYEDHYITRDQLEIALAEPIHTVRTVNPFFVKAPYYAEFVRQYVLAKYGREKLYQGGLKIYTYLDVSLQKAARKAIEMGLRALDKRQGYRGPLGYMDLSSGSDACEALKVGEKDLSPPQAGEIRKGVIVGVDKAHRIFKICVAGVPGIIPPEGYKWAKKRPEFSVKSLKHVPQDIFEVLKRGDIIEVKLLSRTDKGWVCSLEEEPLAQSALFSVDVKTGEVLAMVGGYRFGKNQFNRAVQSKRQPGSAFKPVIYAAALDKGLTAASIILDSPIIYRQFDQKAWKPENYEEHFYGPTTLREGLVHSRNVVTVKILRKIGISYVLKYVKGLGITAKLSPNLSLALGSSAMSLKELTFLYGIFARGGWDFKPLFVEKIVDWDGKTLEAHPVSTNTIPTGEAEMLSGKPETDPKKPENTEDKEEHVPLFQPKRVMTPQTSYILTTILEDVVKHGTGWRARVLKRPCAGKTGTTSSYRDAWFMGYTPQILTGVWVGFDNEISLGKHETGSRAACPIWTMFMLRALKDIPKMEFPAPPGIVYVSIDPKTGLLARPKTPHAYLECFKEGTEPRDYTDETKKSKPLEFFQLDQ